MPQLFFNNMYGELLEAVDAEAEEIVVALHNVPELLQSPWGFMANSPAEGFTLSLFTRDQDGEQNMEIVLVREASTGSSGGGGVIITPMSMDPPPPEGSGEEEEGGGELSDAVTLVLQVIRGCEGTEKVPHDVGTTVEHRVTAASIEGLALSFESDSRLDLTEMVGAVSLVPATRSLNTPTRIAMQDGWVKAEGQWQSLPEGQTADDYPLAKQYEYKFAPYEKRSASHPNTSILGLGTSMMVDGYAGVTKGGGAPTFLHIPPYGRTNGTEVHRDIPVNGNLLDVRAIPRYTRQQDEWSFKERMYWRLFATTDASPYLYLINVDTGAKESVSSHARITSVQNEGRLNATVLTYDDPDDPIRMIPGIDHLTTLTINDDNAPRPSLVRSCFVGQEALVVVYEAEPTVARVYSYDVSQFGSQLLGATLAYAYDFGVPVRKVGVVMCDDYRAMFMLAEGDDTLHVYDARGGIGGIYLGAETTVLSVPDVVHDFHGGRDSGVVLEVDDDPYDTGLVRRYLHRVTRSTSTKLLSSFVDVPFGPDWRVREMGYDANTLLIYDVVRDRTSFSATTYMQTLLNAVKLPSFQALNDAGLDVYLRTRDAAPKMPMPSAPPGYPSYALPWEFGGGDGGGGFA